MSVWIVTGPSGAGKATVLAALEAAGVDCVDNLPAELFGDFANLPRANHAAAVVDARQGQRLASMTPAGDVHVLFLDARDDVLVRRLAESTRPHPCAAAGSGPAAVVAERGLLQPLRAAADLVIDTSELDPGDLGRRVRRVVADNGEPPARLHCTISSFGHKFGPPLEADWVIDARLVRNPFWVDDLRPQTGLDPDVRAYVLGDSAAKELMFCVTATFDWATSQYRQRGRRFLHIAIGCTGGRHRSVVLAEELGVALRGKGEVAVEVRHRDVDKPDPRT